MDPHTRQFVERMGLLSEEDGLPRIAGRIFGYLLVSPAERSLDELAEALEVSRASVSTDARRLVARGLLERRSRPGDRRDYYAIARDGFRESLRGRVRQLATFHALLEEARALPQADAGVRARLGAWNDAYATVLDLLSGLLRQWDVSEPPGGGAG